MSDLLNIYCDESCHLEHDKERVMTLGAVWCPVEKSRGIADRLREIKRAHGLGVDFELKWSKVSSRKLGYYLAVLDYFLDDDDLHFRGLVADKTKLDHAAFGQSHDLWYYKMFFTLLNPLLPADGACRIYLDKKDTCGGAKVKKLEEVLRNSAYDFDGKVVERVQIVESHDVESLQLADFLIGAIGYANRGLSGNAAKSVILARLRDRTRYTLTKTTLLRESKLNIFIWKSANGGQA